MTFVQLLNVVNKLIVNPLITLLFVLALLLFFVGLIRFLIFRNDPKKTEEIEHGKKHMLWGVFGIFFIIATFGIIRVIVYTLGAQGYIRTGYETGKIESIDLNTKLFQGSSSWKYTAPSPSGNIGTTSSTSSSTSTTGAGTSTTTTTRTGTTTETEKTNVKIYIPPGKF